MNHAERRIRYFIEMWGSDTKSKICDRSSNSPFVQTKIIEVLKRYWPKNDENHLIIISLFKQKHLTLRSILPLVYWLLFIEGTSLSNYFSIHEHLGGKGICHSYTSTLQKIFRIDARKWRQHNDM